MAKLTLNDLRVLVDTEVDASKISQIGGFSPDEAFLTDLLVKIGEQYDISSVFENKLGRLIHNNLEFGTTVEEWFVDLRLPVAHDPNGTSNMAPKDPTFQDVAYSYVLDKYVADTTIRNEDIKNGFLNESKFSQMTARIMDNLYKTQSLHRYGVSKQLIGRFIDAIDQEGQVEQVTIMSKPTDTATIEAFAKVVKDKVEEMTDLITETNNIAGVPARSPSLTLYVLPGIRSIIDIDLLAGAFNENRAQVPVEILVLEDFGELEHLPNAWGLLVDDRGLRIYPSQTESDFDRNGQGGFTNYYLKEAYTVAFSRVVNAHVFTA